MKPEHPDEALLEQGLAAWDVPEPPPGLTDRILAQNAETLTALSTPANPIASQPRALEPGLKEDTPAMLPTDLRTESSMRPFWTATALGFAAAAAILVAFMAGRQSTTPAAIAPVVPSVEIQVTAPAPVAVPPKPPAPPVPGETTVRYYEDKEAVETIPEPPKVPRVRGIKRRSPRGSTSPDLKNPFRDDAAPGDLENPFGDDAASDSPDSLFPNDTTSSNLENPFGNDPPRPPTPAGRTKASGASTTGGSHQQAIQATIKHRTRGLQACYNKALRTQPELAGKMTFSISIDLAGSVTSVAVGDDTLGDKSVKTCVEAKIDEWRFPMNGATEPAEVSFSVVFSAP